MNRVPTRIDLTPYDEKAVKTFVDYVHSDDQSNLKLSFYALADLIDLARSLLVPGLLKQLEDTLIELASKKTDALIQALIIVGGDRAIAGGMSARRKIESIAAAEFQTLIKHKSYGYIPPIVFGNIIGRCDLNVKNEMEVVDAGILWLWQQKKRLFCTLIVFSRIRTAFLSRGDRETIRARLKTLYRGEKAIPLVMSLLSSTHCRRCCVIKEHIDTKMIRCGVPTAPDDIVPDLKRLPLSAPTKKYKRKETEIPDISSKKTHSKTSESSKKSKKSRHSSRTGKKSEKSESSTKTSKTETSKKSVSSKANEIKKMKSKLNKKKKKKKSKTEKAKKSKRRNVEKASSAPVTK